MSTDNPISTYLSEINKALQAGNATEHTHRPALKALVESVGRSIDWEVTATNEPKQEACGAPDYVVTLKSIPLGHIEAKDVGKDLDKAEKTDQLKRYLDGLPSLILTDYLEFRWFVFGEHRMTVALDSATSDGADEVTNLITEFLKHKVKTIKSPDGLAKRMGGLARLMRDAISAAFKAEVKGGELHAQLKGFRRVLIEGLSEEQFADMYAQTICYGLFAARCNHKSKEPFTRFKAAHELPRTNPFLREIFSNIAGPELDERVTWIVDDLAELLDRTDTESILKDFGRRTRREDPVVHFYETFLAEYDPKLREMRGVYYTPEPVVSYIVQSVDAILKRDFKIADGIADASKVKLDVTLSGGRKEAHRVTILDPATGTGTFLYEIIRRIHDHIQDTGQIGSWSSYVSQHLLRRVFGFELLMAPYAVCHMKLGLQLTDTGYDFRANERLRVYLTNSLEEAHELTDLPLFAQHLAREALEAGEAKQNHPVMVVLGNPPYSGHSVNKGEWITDLMESYKDGCPELRKPGQAKWLSDDYVKFLRFAQWRIEQTGYGVLAFITNHGYLNNPTFRGMRQSLMNTFDDIYVLDLHGNTKRKERAPDGTADQNVFDIQQGVAIGIFVRKKAGKAKTKPAIVRHAELWGTRESWGGEGDDQQLMGGKYHWLWENNVTTTPWKKLKPQDPFHLFIPQDFKLLKEYGFFWGIPDVFAPYGDPAPGMVTTHDQFAISWSEDEAIKKVERLLATKTEAEARNIYRLCSQKQWQYLRAKAELASGNWRQLTTPVLYRPFDTRWTVYDRNVAVHRRERASYHLKDKPNLSLCSTRAIEIHRGWEHVFCSNQLIQHHTVSLKEVNYIFPLYLYPKNEKDDLFDEGTEATDAPGGRRPNLSDEFIADLKSRLKLDWLTDGAGNLKKAFGPEDVFHYIYAVLHSPAYRHRYGEFLKIDFPRLPLTSNIGLFRDLRALGRELVALHLTKDKRIVTTYPVDGSHAVEQAKYTAPKGDQPGRVWVNKTQYFEGVPQEVWDLHIGGYRVCQKWLKDRKGRTLDFDDIQHYQNIVAALDRTIEIMDEIDSAIDSRGGWPLQ